MPIADDWDFNYTGKVLSHIDGILNFDTGAGRAPVVGEYVYGATSGAIGKVLAVTGSTASGTLTLTNTVGLFEDNELLEVASELGFDGLTDLAAALQGASIGDTVSGQSSGSTFGPIVAIEYNNAEQTLGQGGGGGTFYASAMSAAFTDDELLDNDTTGQTDIGDADGVGVDNDAALTTTLVNNAGIDVPGTADTNDSCIIHYDAGTQLVPEQAIIEGVTSGAVGLVEQQYGPADGSVGSLRLVDSDYGAAAFQNDETLRVQQVVNYDGQVGGQVFSVGDIVVGLVSGATGRVLAVVDDGDNTGRIILADESGTWDDGASEAMQVGGVTIALVENATTTLNVATANLPDGTRTHQRPLGVAGGVHQGGIYDIAGTNAGDSLNIVRKSNSLYTLSQDTFDELVQLDDDEAIDATGKNLAYQIIFDWEIPDLSFRFLRAGAWTDTDSQNIWANAQSTGAQNKITDTAFLVDTTQPFWQPQLFIEQDQKKIDTHWLEGNIDVLIKVKTWGDTRFIDPATPALGKLIPGGDPSVDGNFAVNNREFHTSTYDTTEVPAAAGGVQTVALGTGDDTASDRNPQGTHTFAWDGGSAATLQVGEMFWTSALLGNDQKIGQVVAQTGDAGASGTVEYVLKSGTQFGDNEALVAEVSGKTFTVDETGGFDSTNDVVAGYGVDIAFSVVDIAADSTSSTIASGPFIPGEAVSQASTGATGRVVLANETTDILYIEVDEGSAAFSGLNVITGGASGATWTPTTSATYNSTTEFAADLNNGEGSFNYSGSVSGDILGTGAETMLNVYQYSKYLAAQEQLTTYIGGPGTAGADLTRHQGRFFRKLKAAYSEVKPGNPFGVYTGSMAFAQGWFLDTDFIASADIRSFSIGDDNDGTRHSPPNLQSLVISNVASGWRVAAFRTSAPASQTIQRTEFDIDTPGGGRNQAADTIIRVAAQDRAVSPLPADVPDNGVLYVLDPLNSGNYLQFPYTAVDRTNNDFPLTSGDIQAVTGAGNDLVVNDNAHVVFIRETASGVTVSNTIQYVADINIFYIARLKGFKPFRGTGTFVSTGATLPAQQTADSIVDLP